MDNYKNVYKKEIDGLNIEYDFVEEYSEDDNQLEKFYDDYAMVLSETERLTSSPEGFDYSLAVASGLIAGIVDAFFVGELGLFENAGEEAKQKFRDDKGNINKLVNKYIENYARKKGYKGDRGLKGAIDYLEKKYPVAQDNTWHGRGISSAKQHHLDDLAHHPSILGLISAIIVQYMRFAVFSSSDGKIHIELVEIDKKEFVKNLIPFIISGFIKWIINIVSNTDKFKEIEEEIPKPIKIMIDKIYALPAALSLLKTFDNWYSHLVSDMAGSKNTAGNGSGLPGLALSFLKELSLLPGFKDSNLPQIISNLYQGTSNSPLTDKLDLRTELTVIKEQQLPVIINEVLVRISYFINHFMIELEKNDNSISNVNWNNVIPFYNRTIVRMTVISSTTMEVVDMVDAGIRAGLKSGGNMAVFGKQFIMRINFVGIGRLVIACSTDAAMGLKKNRLEYALASGDVAITADEMVTMIEKIENIKTGTNHNIKQLTEQTEELSNFKF